MRILMFGRGVIATIYGYVLQAAGHDVEYYVRPGRARELGHSVQLDLLDGRRSLRGRRVRMEVPARLREVVEPADHFELVVLSVGHHRLGEAAAFLAPRIGSAPVLLLGNVWDEPLRAIEPLPAEQVVFGFPQAGGGLDDGGTLRAAMFSSVVLEAPHRPLRSADLLLRKAFEPTGLSIAERKDMRGWLWLHFIADVGMHAQALRLGGMPRLIGNHRGLRDALLISRELLPLLAARGLEVRDHRRATFIYRVPGLAAVGMALATRLMPIARVSLASHTDPRAPEALAVLCDAREQAGRYNVPTPLLDNALWSSGY